jgi:MFS transporter, DHA1 family, tetracycline resistance protein
MDISDRLRGKNAVLSGNFLILLITWVLMYSTQPIADTFSSKYFVSLGATPFLLSVIFFAGSLAIAFVQIPGGYLADKHGRKWIITTMTFGLVIGFLFFVLAPSWEFVIIGLVIQNLCLIYQPALMAMMLDSLDPAKRGTGMNFQSVLMDLVGIPAPLIAGVIVLIGGQYVSPQSNMGMRIAYSIVLVAYLVAATLRIKLKETLPANGESSHPQIGKAFRNYIKIFKESWQVWKKVPRAAYYIFWSTVATVSIVSAIQIYFVLYATDVLKITGSQYAIAAAFMLASPALPALWIGFQMDTRGRKRYLILGYLMYIPAMLLFMFANFYGLLAAFFFFGLGNLLRTNSAQVLLGDFVPREHRGKAVGSLQFFMYLAQALVYLLVGFLYSYVSPSLPFLLLAIVSVPLVLIVAWKIPEPKKKEI